MTTDVARDLATAGRVSHHGDVVEIERLDEALGRGAIAGPRYNEKAMSYVDR